MDGTEQNIFVEQAEYIAIDAFRQWNIEHPDETVIIRKLSQSGAKLITGPRGSGKTTLLLKTYYKLCNSTENHSVPVYVNFKSSLKIEPLYRKNSNAVYWFNQWLLFKIYQGIYKTLNDMGFDGQPNYLRYKKQDVDSFISKIELGTIDTIKGDIGLTISILEEEIQKVLQQLGKNHCVLLLDDAAHAFSSEQQRDFFDFFRQIKSRHISPKAAIYPGVTTYSSTFHVGHDAEEIDIWIKPESVGYLDFMIGLLKQRLPAEVFDILIAKIDLLEILCYTAFGIPRALLNMVQTFYKEEDKNEVKYDRTAVLKAVRNCLNQSMSIYLSLSNKLPIYEKFITNGELIFTRILDAIKEYNKGKSETEQTVVIAINKPLPAELSKVLSFFQYSGLLMPRGDLSKGNKGVYELYSVHYAALVERNAFVAKKSITTMNLAISLKKRNAHSLKRVTPNSLIGTEDVADFFPLSLPPCQVCGAPRVSEHAKFCLECGSQLKIASIFESLIKNDISVLPLTSRRVNAIKKHSLIRTVKDILMDNGNKELRKVPQIGPHWAKEIISYAEEYLV
ncbi:MAG: hypothetical protein P4N59_29410 [Negativicutes bacterium]|nr:hypothetical protein [Negativicutes bacterium]